MRMPFSFFAKLLTLHLLFSNSAILSAFFDPLPPAEDVEFSLLTVGIGSGLEKRYGHTILHVRNVKTSEAYLLNWGTFDFEQPNYVPRFLKGLLRYWVSESSYRSTIVYYRDFEYRSVMEDSIRLSLQQKGRFLKLLEQNLDPEKRYFWYDFFYKNCSTIPRDLINEVLDDQIRQRFEKEPASLNLREYVRQHLNEWSMVAFFLDIMLNSEVDGQISAWTEMFYPLKLREYLQKMTQVDDQGHLLDAPLLQDEKTLVEGGVYPSSPLNPFLCALILGVLLSLGVGVARKRKQTKLEFRLLGSYSMLLGVLSGFTSTVLVMGWAFSKHTMLYHNANLFVLWPLDFVLMYWGFQIFRGRFTLARSHKVYMYAHMFGMLIHAVAFFCCFKQDVSQVLIYLSPVFFMNFALVLTSADCDKFHKL